MATTDEPDRFRDSVKGTLRFAGMALIVVLSAISISYGQTESYETEIPGLTISRKMADESGITGTVVDSNGALIPGTEIDVTKEGTEKSAAAIVGDHGSFSFRGLLPGTYELIFSAAGFATKIIPQIELNENELLNLRIELESQTQVQNCPRVFEKEPNIKGVVLDQDGAIIPGAVIEAVSKETGAAHKIVSDDEGRFDEYLETGRFELTVSKPGYVTKELEEFVVEGDEIIDIEIVLAPVSSNRVDTFESDSSLIADDDLTGVRGTVRDWTGAPVAGAKVSFINRQGKKKRTVTTGHAGHFSINELPAGFYSVTVEAVLLKNKKIKKYMVRKGTVSELDIRLGSLYKKVVVGLFSEAPAIDFNKTDISSTVYKKLN